MKVLTRPVKESEKLFLNEMFPFKAEKKTEPVPKSRKSRSALSRARKQPSWGLIYNKVIKALLK